ncbi:hypothetical protein M8818_000003 [Zalaria obscura]|uniref:Uncharacterized protein n=1 Tax=Zalaria obscura TaxID=2024903 RepID=A0ACC3SND4_9PEZI
MTALNGAASCVSTDSVWCCTESHSLRLFLTNEDQWENVFASVVEQNVAATQSSRRETVGTILCRNGQSWASPSGPELRNFSKRLIATQTTVETGVLVHAANRIIL